MKALLIRNLKVYFRDKASVFFSLLGVLIIFMLYLLFLGDVWISNLPGVPSARALMDSWIISGLLAVTSVTTVMGAFGTMVDDRAHKIIKDFDASPVSRSKIVAGYELSSFVVGTVMSLFALVLGELYIVARGGLWLSPAAMLTVVGLILLSALCNTALVSFVISFFKSQNAFSTASSLLGTLVGFLTGIYMPVGMMPDAVQVLIKVFPVSHAALLLRQTIMAVPLTQTFAGAPEAMRQSFESEMGIVFQWGGSPMSAATSLGILIGASLLFYGLSILQFSRKSR
ncbi:MAG: ABC transporter permease [Candidatus Limiplasma sp.]|nr:ABC transporter permease [Candidatus Limiplasma sp.]